MEDIDPIMPPISDSTEASRMLWMSDAYAEAASLLCEAIVQDDFKRLHTSTRVILHLCRHSFELFLKGAICAKSGKTPPTSHRLDKLHAQYVSLFPEEKHLIDSPFPSQVLEDPSKGLFPGSLKDYQSSHDQRYRYPSDVAGIPFEESEPFDVAAYQKSIKKFRQQINLMVAKIDFNWEF